MIDTSSIALAKAMDLNPFPISFPNSVSESFGNAYLFSNERLIDVYGEEIEGSFGSPKEGCYLLLDSKLWRKTIQRSKPWGIGDDLIYCVSPNLAPALIWRVSTLCTVNGELCQLPVSYYERMESMRRSQRR